MLPKSSRINLKKDFKWVAAGKKTEGKFLKIFFRAGENPPAGGPRVGIALSSQTFKKATDRNRAKRLISFAFETLYSKLPTNISIVALPKAGVVSVKSSDVLSDLKGLLDNEKLID